VNLSSFQAEAQGTWHSAAVVPTPNATVAATVALQPAAGRGPSNLTWAPAASSFASFLIGTLLLQSLPPPNPLTLQAEPFS